VGLKPPQIAEIGNFWYKFAKKGYTPLTDFYKIWLVEGVTGLHPRAKFQRCGFKNVGLQPPRSRKIVIFGVNLPLQENSGGPQKNLNIGAQLQTFLHAMTS